MNVNKNIAISDSGFIFNPSTGDSFSTNKTGIEIIRMLKEGKNKDLIIQSISMEYKIEKLQAEKDFSDFVMMLQNFQMIQSHE